MGTKNEFGNDIIEVNAEYEKLEIAKVSAAKTGLSKIENVSKADIRALVKLYYETQKLRMVANNFATKNDDAIVVNAFLPDAVDYKILEKNIENQLSAIAQSQPEGRWLMKITGIGPVLAAGLLAHFDIEKANYATNFVSYAGLNDNNRPWLGREKSKKILDEILDGRKTITDDDVVDFSAVTGWKYDYLRDLAYNEKTDKWSAQELVKAAAKMPYNNDLKVLLWKCGESFVKQRNRESSIYGRLFNERLMYETILNNKGAYAEQAKRVLETKNIGKDTIAYQSYINGKLPKAHIYARASRWVQKIFVNHIFVEMYVERYHQQPPNPYIVDHSDGEHNIIIAPEVPYTVQFKGPDHSMDARDINMFEEQYRKALSASDFKKLDKLKQEVIEEQAASKAKRLEEERAEKEVEEAPKKKPGRPKKVVEEVVETPKRKPGRPKKVQETPVEEPKKKRGRPRKNPEA